MFFGAEALQFASMLVLASAGEQSCELPRFPDINVTSYAQEVRYDYSQTLKDIQTAGRSPDMATGFSNHSFTQGYMKGTIKITPTVAIKHTKYTRTGMVCAWFDSIDVNIQIAPTIVIPREVKHNRCTHRVVKEHELRHVEVDQYIIDKYAPRFKQAVRDVLIKDGARTNLFRDEIFEPVMQALQDRVMGAVEAEMALMNKERDRRQKAIDTNESYAESRSECDDWTTPDGDRVTAEGILIDDDLSRGEKQHIERRIRRMNLNN